MKQHKMTSKNSEAGSASAKLVAILAILFLVAHAGYNYIPVAYEGQYFKQEMETAVVQGMAVPPGKKPVDMVKGKIDQAVAASDLPEDALVEVKSSPKGGVAAHVSYTKQINMLPFGIYKYNYEFDHTAAPTGFLLKQ